MKIFSNREELTKRIGDVNDYPFVFSDGYAQFISVRNEKVILIADDNNVIIPVRSFKVKFLKCIQILYTPLKNAQRLSASDEKVFLDKLLIWMKEKRFADRIVQPPPFCIFKAFPKDSQKAEFGTYFINLKDNSEIDLFQKIHPKHRNVIQNVINKGGQIRSGREELSVFYDLYKNTMCRSNLYCEPFEYFESFYDHLSKNILCSVIYFNEKPQGAIFVPYTNQGAYYLYGASVDTIELTGAMNYLHWETIKQFKNRGIKRYDFVGARLSDVSGTKLEGIQKFKQRFGSQLEKGYLWKADLRKYRCILFDLLLKARSILTGGLLGKDIIDQENFKMEVDRE